MWLKLHTACYDIVFSPRKELYDQQPSEFHQQHHYIQWFCIIYCLNPDCSARRAAFRGCEYVHDFLQFLYQTTQLFERWLTSPMGLASRALSSASNFYRSLAEREKKNGCLEPLHQELLYLQTSSNIGITSRGLKSLFLTHDYSGLLLFQFQREK